MRTLLFERKKKSVLGNSHCRSSQHPSGCLKNAKKVEHVCMDRKTTVLEFLNILLGLGTE
jgi:hypothetical protein